MDHETASNVRFCRLTSVAVMLCGRLGWMKSAAGWIIIPLLWDGNFAAGRSLGYGKVKGPSLFHPLETCCSIVLSVLRSGLWWV